MEILHVLVIAAVVSIDPINLALFVSAGAFPRLYATAMKYALAASAASSLVVLGLSDGHPPSARYFVAIFIAGPAVASLAWIIRRQFRKSAPTAATD